MLFASMLFYGLFASIVSYVVVTKANRSSMRKALLINSMISFFYCWAIFSAAHFLSLGLYWFGAEWLFRKQLRVGWIWLIEIVACLIGHAVIGVVFGIPYTIESQRIADSLPITYLDDRLPFDRKLYPTDIKPRQEEPLDLDYRNSYQRSLATYHHTNLQRFINSPGFGVGRMRIPNIRDIQSDLFKEKLAKQIGKMLIVKDLNDWVEQSLSVDKQEWFEMNRDFRNDFVSSNTWGMSIGPRKFIGFQSHQLGDSNLWSGSRQFKADRYVVQSVELIGLLLANEPRCYQTEHLPQMDEAIHAPVRPLDVFEKVGLQKIVKGDELFAMSNHHESIIRMLGAIRASDSCLKCHECQNGDLLGIFTYTIAKQRTK